MDVVQQSLPQTPPNTAPPFSAARTIRLICLTLALGYLIVLGGTYLKGDFLVDRQDRPIANDFVNVVAAGQLVRVAYVESQDKDFLKFAEEQGLVPGKRVNVEQINISADSVTVRPDGHRAVVIGMAAAERIHVDTPAGSSSSMP